MSARKHFLDDYIGHTFGHLTVVGPEERINGNIKWMCECSCGSRRLFTMHGIIYGQNTSCGSIKCRGNKYFLRDHVGKRVGKLVILNEAGMKNGRTAWLCECDCGEEVLVHPNKLLSQGQASCGRRSCRSSGHRRSTERNSGLLLLYGRYKASAKSRGIEFGLSIDDFDDIASMNCEYCGVAPYRVTKSAHGYDPVVRNGVDRVDSTCGYFLDNVVPACKACNLAKSDMTLTEFNEWIARLCEFNKKRIDK